MTVKLALVICVLFGATQGMAQSAAPAVAPDTTSVPFRLCDTCTLVEQLVIGHADLAERSLVSRSFDKALDKETFAAAVSGRVTTENRDVIQSVELYGSKSAIARATRRPDGTFKVSRDNGPAEPLGQWLVVSNTNKFDYTKTVFISLASAEPIAGGDKQALLIVACAKDKTELFIGDLGSLGPRNEQVIQWRLDAPPIKTETWSILPSKSALHAPQSVPLLKQMFAASEFAIKMRLQGDVEQVLLFKVGGLEEAIKPVRQACSW